MSKQPNSIPYKWTYINKPEKNKKVDRIEGILIRTNKSNLATYILRTGNKKYLLCETSDITLQQFHNKYVLIEGCFKKHLLWFSEQFKPYRITEVSPITVTPSFPSIDDYIQPQSGTLGGDVDFMVGGNLVYSST